ncbi:MAG: pyridoxamine 5'-phosphate oxidase family protein [Acidimicrobiales bacterium]
MFDPETQAFLHSGCGLLVATVSPDGEPHATRGWGLDIVELGPPAVVRVLLDADDERTLEHAAAGGAVAITAANVLTLRSLQLKGWSQGLDAASSVERVDRYVRAFHHDVELTDRVSWDTFKSFFPSTYVACIVSVAETFDQTPGPGAGARTGSS